MSYQINRKQIIMVGLAVFLAMVSYLIPLPQSSNSQSKSEVYIPVEQSKPVRPTVVTDETAITWQFPRSIEILQSTLPSTLDVTESPLDRSRTVEGMLAQDQLVRGEKDQVKMALPVSFKNDNQLPKRRENY